MDIEGQPATATLLRWWAVSIAVVSLPFVQLMAGTKTAVQGDNYEYHLPIWSWIWRAISGGHSPFWAGFDFGGQNVAGIGQGAIFYPLNAVFMWSDTVSAFRWWTMAHLWLAASGAFVWSWRRWRSPVGALVSGIVYGLNGALVLHMVHMNFTIAIAWMPWMFLGLDALIERGGARRLAGFAAPVAIIAFAGHPQMLWAALVGAGIVTICQLSFNRSMLRPLLRIAAGVSLGLGIAAVQLLPQYLFSRTSQRPTLTTDIAFGNSATTSDLFTALFPWFKGGAAELVGVSQKWHGVGPYHEVANHVGLAAVALALVALIARRRDRRVIALGALALFAVVMALANNSPLGQLIYNVVPMADRFRIWPRYLVLANVAAASLAGLGTKLVLDAPLVWRGRLLVMGVVAATLAVVFPLVTDADGRRATGSPLVLSLVIPIAALFLAIIAVHVAVHARHRAAILVVVAVAVPAVLFALGAPWRSHALTPEEASAFFDRNAPTWQVFDAEGGVDRWMTQSVSHRGEQMVHDTARINSYDPLLQKDFATITGARYAGGFDDGRMWSPGWLADVLRVTTLLQGLDTTPSDPAWIPAEPARPPVPPIWHRAPRLAEAYVVGQVVLDDVDGISSRLQDPSENLTGKVYMDDSRAVSGAFAGLDQAGEVGTVTGAMGAYGSGNFTVHADRPGVLVISSGWLDGWSATVNGHAAPVGRANGLVLAVPVGAGDSVVHLEFNAPGLRSGVVLTFLSLLTLIAVAVVPTLRRRRARPQSFPEVDSRPSSAEAFSNET